MYIYHLYQIIWNLQSIMSIFIVIIIQIREVSRRKIEFLGNGIT